MCTSVCLSGTHSHLMCCWWILCWWWQWDSDKHTLEEKLKEIEKERERERERENQKKEERKKHKKEREWERERVCVKVRNTGKDKNTNHWSKLAIMVTVGANQRENWTKFQVVKRWTYLHRRIKETLCSTEQIISCVHPEEGFGTNTSTILDGLCPRQAAGSLWQRAVGSQVLPSCAEI